MRIFLALFIFSLSFSYGQNLDNTVRELIQENLAETTELRHWFHQNAELSNREFKTSERIALELRKIGLEPQTGIAKTGVVAVLNEGKAGPVVALRADIDGYPPAMRLIASIYQKGTWKTQDKKLAAAWSKRANRAENNAKTQ